ncbi:hypothetical protein EST38_g10527 [Candolleomyces aberdarensis]|uniref:Major facilitator superfamily (MFS) profile domain-containing protein n=1 Tax=Candolleomyces aberdarensis TaxID=2316362 RepID=A0A4Q2D759_9AGAR|nr:hypothetical protein EST38_g10527 [Candolleomyces aberdarensis]
MAGSIAIPESPRWLIDVGRNAEGLRVIADLHGGGDPAHPVVQMEYDEIVDKVTEERESGGDRTYAGMWKRYKRRVLLAMSSLAFAQLNGINVISYYAPRVFEEAGWIGRDAILMTGINSVIYLLSTIPTWVLVDRWGRRAILMSGAVVMALALVATGLWMRVDVAQTPSAVVICVIIFNAAFGYSWGPIPWLYPPECFLKPKEYLWRKWTRSLAKKNDRKDWMTLTIRIRSGIPSSEIMNLPDIDQQKMFKFV